MNMKYRHAIRLHEGINISARCRHECIVTRIFDRHISTGPIDAYLATAVVSLTDWAKYCTLSSTVCVADDEWATSLNECYLEQP